MQTSWNHKPCIYTQVTTSKINDSACKRRQGRQPQLRFNLEDSGITWKINVTYNLIFVAENVKLNTLYRKCYILKMLKLESTSFSLLSVSFDQMIYVSIFDKINSLEHCGSTMFPGKVGKKWSYKWGRFIKKLIRCCCEFGLFMHYMVKLASDVLGGGVIWNGKFHAPSSVFS